MNSIEHLRLQTADSYSWTLKLIESIPFNKWEVIPEIIETNVTWQTGHLLLSNYYHAIMVIQGHHRDVLQNVPMKEYGSLFSQANPKKSLGKTDSKELLIQLKLVQNKSLEVIQSLSENELKDQLFPMDSPHPIAKNKFEALDWNIKHTMWHCGQLGILMRVIHTRYDFGLK